VGEGLKAVVRFSLLQEWCGGVMKGGMMGGCLSYENP
jgi:hypothetical protein